MNEPKEVPAAVVVTEDEDGKDVHIIRTGDSDFIPPKPGEGPQPEPQPDEPEGAPPPPDPANKPPPVG